MSHNHSQGPKATIFRRAGGVNTGRSHQRVPIIHHRLYWVNQLPTHPFPPFECLEVEEWLKSSEKTKVKLICTPHKSPLQKITTKNSHLSHSSNHEFPLLTETHPLFQLPPGISPTLQLLPLGIHPLFNFPYGLPNLVISFFLAHWGRSCSTHTRFLHDLTYLRNFVKSDNLCIQTCLWERILPCRSWHVHRMDSSFESASRQSPGSTM